MQKEPAVAPPSVTHQAPQPTHLQASESARAPAHSTDKDGFIAIPTKPKNTKGAVRGELVHLDSLPTHNPFSALPEEEDDGELFVPIANPISNLEFTTARRTPLPLNQTPELTTAPQAHTTRSDTTPVIVIVTPIKNKASTQHVGTRPAPTQTAEAAEVLKNQQPTTTKHIRKALASPGGGLFEKLASTPDQTLSSGVKRYKLNDGDTSMR
ncbi:unnamed protein product [Calypogeia fissa]